MCLGSVTAEPGTYYTYAWSVEGEPLVLQDTPATDPSKATVYFYNLSDLASVDLFVPTAKVKAIEAIAGDTAKSVALKAAAHPRLRGAGGRQAGCHRRFARLRRRGGVSIVFTGSTGSTSATAVENAFFSAQ